MLSIGSGWVMAEGSSHADCRSETSPHRSPRAVKPAGALSPRALTGSGASGTLLATRRAPVRSCRRRNPVDASGEMQRERGLTDAVVLDPPAIERRFPALEVADTAGGLLGPTDGFVDAVQYCELLARLGQAGGGQVLQGAPVRGIRVQSGRVVAVELDGNVVECEHVVNAGGAWARAVGRLAGVDLPIDGYRRQLVNLESPEPFAAPVPMVIE